MHGRLQGRLATAVRGFPCTPGISGVGLILRSLYKFAELIRDVSHGPGLSVEFLACRRTLFCGPAQTEAGVARPRWYDQACVSSSLQCWLWARTGRSGFRRTLRSEERRVGKEC